MSIVNAAVWYLKVIKRVDPKSSHHKGENLFFFFSSFLYLHEMMDAN